MLVRGCRAQGHKYPPWEILQDSQGYRRSTLTTQLFTREHLPMLWPTATLRLLQAQSQPELWHGATLRLYKALYSQPRQPKIHKGAAKFRIFSPANPQDQRRAKT